jgi:IS605 OrfB family transposase
MYLTTKIQQTEQKHEVDLSILRSLCYHSARLYNVAMYSVRQHYFNTQSYLNYYKNYSECKNNEHYKILLSDCSQQILRLVDRDMQSFFKLLVLKNSGRYSEKIKLPRYKKQDELSTCTIQGRSCRIQKDGRLAIGLTTEFREKYNITERRILFTIPSNIRSITQFKEVRIIPQYNGKQFVIEFIYESNKLLQQVHGNGYMSIDLGVDNLAACTIFSNGDAQQFLIDGRRLKSINHYYNKKMAMLQSSYSTNKSITAPTNRMLRLMNGRNNRINDYFNKTVKLIINACLDNDVTTLVIGYNKKQKQEINIGKINNQNTVMIPLYKLRQKLQYQCELHGIKYCPQEESYTSKASALDNDNIPNYGDTNIDIPIFSGNRIHRGLYRSSDGSVLNADINGSINILKKYFKERKSNGPTPNDVRVLVNAPCQRLSAFAQAHRL